MTKEKAKEISDILLAYSQGKTIQVECKDSWTDLKKMVSGDLKAMSMLIDNSYLKYRIKPELKLVPFTFEDNILFRDKWFIKKEFLSIRKMTRVDKEAVYFNDYGYSYNDFLTKFTFEDGSPCGKYIEG